MRSLLEDGTFLGTIISQIDKAGKDALEIKDKKKDDNSLYLGGSISNKANNLIMTFPTLCDNSLPASTASMINKANERKIVTMLQLLFASMSLEGKDGEQILSKIHTNIKMSYGMDDVIDKLDSFVDKYDPTVLESAEFAKILKVMQEELKIPQKSFPVESFNEKSLNEYTVLNIHGKTVVKEDITTAPAEDPVKAKRDADKFDNDQYQSKYQVVAKQLLDSDVKKANEMVPTLMVVQFNELDKDGKPFGKKPFVAGIKSRLISVDSSDVVERMIVKNKTKVNFLNFVRAYTGEIKFVRDFLLCIDRAKIDAKNAAKKGEAAQMWKVLENRSSKNFRNKYKRSGNDASAITTLVLNQETVNILKKEYDFDIEKISNARMILDAYNLLGIIIADESIEVVKFLYAGNDMFEQQAYSYLEKESNDGSYKKIINLIGKMNGR